MEAKSLNYDPSLGDKIADIFECPSCNLRLKSLSEVAKHCELEIERLRQMSKDEASKLTENTKTLETNENERQKPYSVFQRVKRNRQTRLKRSRKRATPPAVSAAAVPTEHSCPICQQLFPANEIHTHAERCLRKSNGHTNGGDGHSSNEDDEEYIEEYEEYEWAGQKRIRASSLLQGGYSSLGIGQQHSNVIRNGSNDTDEEDLNVDEDDTQIYGPAQYNEADIITTEGDASSYMRSLMTGQTSNIKSDEISSEEITQNSQLNSTTLNCQPSSSSSSGMTTLASPPKTTIQNSTSHFQQIIESLKAKLRYYENHIPSKYKCLICLDDYKKPAISVACWHVHCEDCWLRSLGQRKLCPQCNLITTAKDLRRIYM